MPQSLSGYEKTDQEAFGHDAFARSFCQVLKK
jgi:hypothetical protein